MYTSDEELIGQPVKDVIETIVNCKHDYDRKTVRENLDPLTDNGVITREAVETAVSDTSQVVATAETRVELAGIAYKDAQAEATAVDDLNTVADRLDRYSDRLKAVEARVIELADDLQTPVEQLDDPNAVYELAVGLRDVATTAQGIVRTADDLSQDLEQFELWLTEPNQRYEEFIEDLDIVDESLDDLTISAASLSTDAENPATDWVDATMRVQLIELLVTDLQAELAELRTWANREDAPFRTDLNERVADVANKTTELKQTLAEQAEPLWHERFDGILSEFEADLDEFEPPVDWNRVQETLEERQEQAFTGSKTSN